MSTPDQPLSTICKEEQVDVNSKELKKDENEEENPDLNESEKSIANMVNMIEKKVMDCKVILNMKWDSEQKLKEKAWKKRKYLVELISLICSFSRLVSLTVTLYTMRNEKSPYVEGASASLSYLREKMLTISMLTKMDRKDFMEEVPGYFYSLSGILYESRKLKKLFSSPRSEL